MNPTRRRIFRNMPLAERPLAAQVAALFANGEQGLWYDPSDLSTMYQDANGTLQVYMPGQGLVDPPIGLILDKRLGLRRGVEQVSTDISTGWSSVDARWVYTASSISWTGGGANLSTSKVLLPTNFMGKFVEFSFVVSGFSGTGNGGPDSGILSSGPNGTGTLLDTRITASGTYRFMGYWRGGGASDGRTIGILGRGTNSFVVSNLSVRELPGNHAYQTTTASRPTLSARYNLLTSSENMAGAVWSKMGVTAGADYITESSASEGHYATQSVPTLPVGTKLRGRAEFKPRTGARNAILRFAGSNGSAYTIVDLSSGAILLTSVTGSNWSWVEPPVVTSMGDGYYSITGFVTTTEPSGAIALWPGMTLGTSLSYLGDGVSSIYIRNTDLRAANDGIGLPPYQRVVDTNTYDTAGFPLYLRFDGVDDFLQTASLDFSGTDKVALVAAIRKLNDGAHGAVCEFSADGSANAGVFSLFAPIQALYSYRFVSKGIYGSDAGLAGFASPHSAVISGIGNISGDVSSIRVNQSSTLTSALDQGTGNYGNYPLYIGCRAGSSLPFNGRLYGLLLRAGALNDGQIQKVEKLLNQKAKVF